MLAMPGALLAQTGIIPLIPYAASWEYLDTGADPGTAWKEIDFGASWPEAAGVFLATTSGTEVLHSAAVAAGAVIRSSLARTNAEGTGQVLTYYFRHRFDLPDALKPYAAHVVLTMSNLVDDGAVLYLNGQELRRLHIPEGAVSAGTYADGAVEVNLKGSGGPDQGGYYEYLLYPTNLQATGNLLAVEVHDVNASSSDAVFGLALGGRYEPPPTITTQPADATVEVNSPFTLSVVAAGASLSYQWQRDLGAGFTNIAGAVSTNYTVTSAVTSHAGEYRVIISNVMGVVTSRAAHVAVVPDLSGPCLLGAVAQGNTITLSFSERLQISSSQATNYAIRELTADTNVVATVQGFPSSTVSLRVAGLDPNANYLLTVNGVRDLAGNVIAPDSQVLVSFAEANQLLVPIDQLWRWTEDNVPLPPEWRTNGLAPYAYGTAPGIFHNAFSTTDYCRGAKNTFVSLGVPTMYFSTTFDLPAVLPGGVFKLAYQVDDGAVLYLNGVEISRINMPAGTISHDTLAATQIVSPVCTTNTITVTNLASGINVLAAEVHQNTPTSPDVVFGLEVQATLVPLRVLPAAPDPGLAIVRNDGTATLSWTGGGWALETAPAPEGPWQEVQPTMTNPYTTTLSDAASQFWRLKQRRF